MVTRHKFAALLITIVLMASLSTGCGFGAPKLSEGDQQKIAALNDALKNGLISQQEHDAKVKDIYTAAASGTPSLANTSSASDEQKLQALEKACSTGALTPEECAQKRAAITGASASSNPVSGNSAPASATAAPMSNSSDYNPNNAPNSPNASQASPSGDGSSNSPQQSNGGNLYNDPQGQFSIQVPQGWTATPQGNNGAGGVQILQGSSYAVVAPFGGVTQPSDVVINLEGQFQKTYQNFTIGQHGPSKWNGLDIAFGKYRGINPKGVPITMVIMGIAAPGGHFYMFLSSVPQTDEQATGPAMAAILQSLHFAGQ